MPWTPIRTMARGARPDFTLLTQPENDYITPAQRWLIDQLLDLEPGTDDVNGGGYAHKPGYHDTVAHNDARSGQGEDYSARDPQDRRGPHNRSRARDWTFKAAQRGDYRRFAQYGDRVLAAYRASDPRLAGWREYLGRVTNPVTIGGVATRRVGIDFRHRYLRIPDPSHDWHGHLSEDTEQVESFPNKWALLTIFAGWTLADWQHSLEEEDMSATAEKQIAELHAAFIGNRHQWAGGRNTVRLLVDLGYALLYGQPGTETTWIARQLAALGQAAGLDSTELAQIGQALRVELDAANIPAAVVDAIGAADTPQEIADRLRPALGDQAAAVGAILAAG
ncbi:hypothetical protein K1W54_28800 [Micromonospora sp. CPCC 205371]|nr:hypothetical protein [Micromonospora sp. CPCC 205371]